MVRFKYEDVDKYGGNGGAGFFSLKEDGEVARVRFMYSSIDELTGTSVHEVEIDGKKRYVNCLREYNAPLDDCPFCREKMFTSAKLFIPLYNIDEDKVQIWERGKKFFGKMSSLFARYPDIVSHEFEIERHGKPHDTQTSYEIYETAHDDTTLEDLPELPQIIGGLILNKSADDMEYYLDEGEFPPVDVEDEEEKEEEPKEERHASTRTNRDDTRRSSRGCEESREETHKPSGRRTPTGRRRDRV